MKIKLNLIPKQKKEQIKRAYFLRIISKWEMEFFFLLIFFVAILISINLILSINIEAENNSVSLVEKNNDKYSLIKEYNKEIIEVNEQIANVKKIQVNQLHWSKLLSKLNEKVFNGIEVTSLVTSDYNLIFSGKANTRDNLIILKDKLSQDDCFSDVGLPLSNLVSKDNVEFQINLKIKKECLK